VILESLEINLVEVVIVFESIELNKTRRVHLTQISWSEDLATFWNRCDPMYERITVQWRQTERVSNKTAPLPLYIFKRTNSPRSSRRRSRPKLKSLKEKSSSVYRLHVKPVRCVSVKSTVIEWRNSRIPRRCGE